MNSTKSKTCCIPWENTLEVISVLVILLLALLNANFALGQPAYEFWKEIPLPSLQERLTYHYDYNNGFILIGSNRTVMLYSEKGTKLLDIDLPPNDNGHIISVGLSPDGKYFAVGTDDHGLYVIDSKGKVLWRSHEPNQWVSAIAIDHGLIAIGNGNTLELWNVSGSLLWAQEVGSWIYDVKFMYWTGQTYIIVGTWGIGKGYNTNLLAFDISGNIKWKTKLENGNVESLAVNDATGMIGAVVMSQGNSGSWYCNIYVLSFGGAILHRINWTTNLHTSKIAFREDGAYLGVPGYFGRMAEVDVSSGKVIPTKILASNVLYFSGSMVVTSEKDTVYIYRTSLGQNSTETYSYTPWSLRFNYTPRAVAVSDNGCSVVGTEMPDGSVYYVLNGKILWSHPLSSSVYDVAITANGSRVYAVGGDVRAFSRNGTLLWRYDVSTTVTSVDSTPNGKYVVAGAIGGVYLFNFKGDPLWKVPLTAEDTITVHVAVSNDGNVVATVTTRNGGYVWYIENGRVVWKKHVTDDMLLSADISPDSNYIAVGGSDGRVYVLNNKGELVKESIVGTVRAVEFFKQGNRLYLAVRANGVKVFTVPNLRKILTIPAEEYPSSPSRPMDVSNDGSYILLADSDGTVSFRSLPDLREGTLIITSTPSNAQILLNGTYLGTTPMKITVKPGKYVLVIMKTGYKNHTEVLDVESNSVITRNVTLTPLVGYVTVTSTPEDAKVYIDGRYVGMTPLENYSIPSGTHEIILRKSGYKEYTKKVLITAGEGVTLSVALVMATPSLQSQTSTNTSSSHVLATMTSSKAIPTKETTSITVGSYSKRDRNTSPNSYALILFLSLVVLGGVTVGAWRVKSRKKKHTQGTSIVGFPLELLDKYEPLEFLGEGGFAKVFKVRRKSDGKIIALKVSRLDEKAKRFFLKEVKAWRLLDHPNIVTLYDAYAEPLPHLELEFVDGVKLNGETIRDLGRYPKPVEESEALHFIKGIASGLAHAHSKEVYHRDLKPQNVLITSDLTPKITDWGLAKVGAVSTTATTTKGLTLLYAAPEQLDEGTYGHTDHRTDIYQLGLIFYELLTGKLPYTGTTPAVVMARVINPAVKPKPPSHYNKALAKYDGIFEKLLAKNKEDRYQSVEEFLADLELIEKIEEERRTLEREIEKTKTTMSLTTNSKELKKLMRQLVEQLSRNAILHAQLNDKAGLINALEDLKAFSKEHRDELESAIDQFKMMMQESVPISKSTLDELKVLLHKVQREVE
ncbi:protein kinase domain-containing protein [Thermococcus henrietii]|uniref:protein kinase domain-containing protein n=1 Tax=Thermococcus henrietii TaxID=2016361 RepID=UPI000C08970B|nr:PEGA domain-containing protein [Thermococcus henrietii]